MKNEVAFRLSTNCELYHQYMMAREEKIKFNNLARYFAGKHFGQDAMTYQMDQRLTCNLQKDGETVKNKSCGLFVYKKTSPTQKAWEEEVVSHIDFEKLNSCTLWYWGLIYKGSYSLWDYKGNVYGYLSSQSDTIRLPDGAEKMKLSEYYRVIEELEEQENYISDLAKQKII